MLLIDFVKLNLVDRASELIENHDFDFKDFNYLMNKGNNKRYNFIKLKPLYFQELSASEQQDVINSYDCGDDAEQDGVLSGDFYRLGEIVYGAHECLRSDNENLLGVWPISNNSALGLIYMNDDCAIVTYL